MHGAYAILGALLPISTVLCGQEPCPTASTHIQIERGSYSSRPGVVFALRHFDAHLLPRSTTAPGCFEKVTVVSHADIQVSNASLTAVFGEKLGKGGSKIKDFQVRNSDGLVTLTGIIVKLIPIHFKIEGPASTDGTLVRMQAKRILGDGLPIKELLSLLGEQLGAILGVDGIPGLKIEGDMLSFSPEQVAHLRGHIKAVVPSSQGLLLQYDSPHPRRRTPAKVAN